jgi:uncharacterized protein YjiS (DUF1127 family)
MGTIDTLQSAQPIHSDRQEAVRKGRPGKRGTIMRVIDFLEDGFARRRSRHALMEMTDAQLKDIGISRADAEREGIRRFWD